MEKTDLQKQSEEEQEGLMREILFRGQRVDTKEWAYGYYFMGFTGIPYILVLHDHILRMTEFYEVLPETVGQFTGLTDKNGKKIFEGDIIEYPPQRKKFIVEFYNDCFGARDKKDNRTRIGSGYDFIIIGNIHDNPKLLP